MTRSDFVNDDRYATDCGPECPRCRETLWIYLAFRPNGYVDGQCACCHAVESFDLYIDDGDELTIGIVKGAHYRAVLSGGTLPARIKRGGVQP